MEVCILLQVMTSPQYWLTTWQLQQQIASSVALHRNKLYGSLCIDLKRTRRISDQIGSSAPEPCTSVAPAPCVCTRTHNGYKCKRNDASVTSRTCWVAVRGCWCGTWLRCSRRGTPLRRPSASTLGSVGTTSACAAVLVFPEEKKTRTCHTCSLMTQL